MRISDWSSDVCSSDLRQCLKSEACVGKRGEQRTEAESNNRPEISRKITTRVMVCSFQNEFHKFDDELRHISSHHAGRGKVLQQYPSTAAMQDRKSTRLNSSH